MLRISDRITVLKDGARVGTLETAAVTEHELIRMMVGRPLSEIYPARSSRGHATCWTLEASAGRGSRAWTCPSGAARSWASSGWWAPVAPSWPGHLRGRPARSGEP